jgi:alpha-mannosidase
MSMPYLGPEDPIPVGGSAPTEPEHTDEPGTESGEEWADRESEIDPPSLAVEPEPGSEGSVASPRGGWTLVALINHQGKEPPASLSDELAQQAWCAVSALWHPSLLARAAVLPRIEPIETPSTPGPREIRVVAGDPANLLPSGYCTGAADSGALVIEAGTDRPALIRRIQEHLGAVGTPETSDDAGMKAVANDFLALGTTNWLLHDLAIAMGHADAINHEALTREVLAGADAWQICDRPTAINRLRAGFEVLTQARERFYPVDAYLVDLCLLDPAMPAGVLAGPLECHVAVTLLAPAQAIENQANQDPDQIAAVCEAITEGWLDIAGGTYTEAKDLVSPVESILWQFRKGGQVYRTYLQERNVETYARRRFGLYTQLPQFAKRFGFRFALHMGFDAGRFPIRSEVKRLWESPDGSSLESLLRPPLAADRAVHGLLIPWKIAATMKNDHVATLALVHWPSPVASWYLDLRHSASYSPVLGRWVTLNDYFHLTDRPYETFRPDPDSYASPYLAQDAARRDPRPISRLAKHHQLRARFAAVEMIRAAASGIAASGATASAQVEPEAAADAGGEAMDSPMVETLIETGRHDEATTALDRHEPFWASKLARGIVAPRTTVSPASRPGYLVFNPLGVPRRVAVILPDAALDLRPEGPLRAAQFTDEGVYAVVDLPAFGFAWVPKEPNVDMPPVQPGGLSARGRSLKNETIELSIDEATGGIRGVMAAGEDSPRLGQQLVMTGLESSGDKAAHGQMKCDRFDVDYAGPALVQATASGAIVAPTGGRSLARFVQRYRLWTGRPVLEIQVELSELDPAWLERAVVADPWNHYLACRWAWPDPAAMLRRTVMLAPEMTEIDRPETPDALDISTRRQRTALLFGGLPYHQKQGGRMLDTLLVAGSETGRSFRLGVVLDLENPFHAALDLITPAPVVPTDEGPPALGARGWLIHLDHKSIAVTSVSFLESTSDGRGWGLAIHLLETSGHSARCRLRFFRNPTWARQVDFQGETVIDLATEGDGILVDLTPSELARVEVTLG